MTHVLVSLEKIKSPYFTKTVVTKLLVVCEVLEKTGMHIELALAFK